MAKKKKRTYLDDNRPFNQARVDEAVSTLEEYIRGKASVDNKATDNQRWWRMQYLDESPSAEDKATRSTSAWAVNSILNKHADIMDSYPKPNVLPREADDESEAKVLTSILPVVLDQIEYEHIYNQMGWDFCVDGGAITGVFWDQMKHNGLGDIVMNNIDIHNLFWKPGVKNIQDSPRLYHVRLEDIDEVRARFPGIDPEKMGPQDTGKITKYIHDDYIDTSNCVEVIDMYYKQVYAVETEVPGVDEEGKPAPAKVRSYNTVLHLAIIVGDQLAFCSENEPGYEKGYYEHGKYPFVVRRAFPIKDTPWGFGYLDIMKSPQAYIDAMDDDIIKIADMKARPRFWAKKNANIDVQKFADWNETIVEVAAGDLGEAVRQIEIYDVPAGIMEHRANKIEELKETSGNRDFNQGGVSGGITAASAVAALQEAGSKLSRDMNKALYRGSREEFGLIIELIRQFYTEPRNFRLDTTAAESIEDSDNVQVLGGDGTDYRFVQYAAAMPVEEDTMTPEGIRHERSIFDISISAEKASPFSRAAQNELIKELYGMGLFDPNNTLPAMTAINAMDFEGKDKIVQELQQNSVILQQLDSAMQMIQMLASQNPMIMQMAVQQGLIDPEMAQQMMMQAQGPQGPTGPAPGGDQPAGDTAPEKAANKMMQDSRLGRIREQTANLASPQ